jgi:Uma2 family endonuclease
METKTLLTVEEFARLATWDTEDYELVEGELVPLPSANPIHDKIRQNVESAVAAYFDQNPIGVDLALPALCRRDQLASSPRVPAGS